MSRISQLTATAVLSSADQFPFNSSEGGDDLRTSLALLTAYLQDHLTFTSGQLAAQYAAPATGETVVIGAADSWLIVTPAGTIAALTITLPAIRAAGQEVLVNTSQAITALTVGGAGTTVSGAPTTLATGGFFRMKYDGVLNVWYRVG
jgi:hypothetical protein